MVVRLRRVVHHRRPQWCTRLSPGGVPQPGVIPQPSGFQDGRAPPATGGGAAGGGGVVEREGQGGSLTWHDCQAGVLAEARATAQVVKRGEGREGGGGGKERGRRGERGSEVTCGIGGRGDGERERRKRRRIWRERRR